MQFPLVTVLLSATISAVLATHGTPSYEVVSLHPNYHGKGGIGKSTRYDYRFIPDYRFIRPVGLLSHGLGHATFGHGAVNPAVLKHHGLGHGLVGHHGLGHGLGHGIGIGHHGLGHGVGIGHHGVGHHGIGHQGLGHGVGVGHHGIGHHGLGHGGHIGLPFVGGHGGFGIPAGVGNLPFIG